MKKKKTFIEFLMQAPTYIVTLVISFFIIVGFNIQNNEVLKYIWIIFFSSILIVYYIDQYLMWYKNYKK